MYLAIPIALAGVAALVGFVATRPGTFRIERKGVVPAPPEEVFRRIDRLADWTAWSPWERMDPTMTRTYSGPEAGAGAAYAWEGDKKVGAGRMEVMESAAPERIVIRLEFLKPFRAVNTTTFVLAPHPEGTEVTWSMHGDNGFMGKAFGLFMDMDSMIGKDYERGLANLRTLFEEERAGSAEA